MAVSAAVIWLLGGGVDAQAANTTAEKANEQYVNKFERIEKNNFRKSTLLIFRIMVIFLACLLLLNYFLLNTSECNQSLGSENFLVRRVYVDLRKCAYQCVIAPFLFSAFLQPTKGQKNIIP